MAMSFMESLSPTAEIILSVAVMLTVGFLMSRMTRLIHIPDVTAYMLTGILIGPFGMNLIPQTVIDGSDFLTDIALALIAFNVGEYFRASILKKNGIKTIIVTVFEACMASVFVFVMTFYGLKLSFPFSILLAALAAATAPASTIMTIHQTHASGEFVNLLLQVAALDDAVGLAEYSAAMAIVLSVLHGVSGSASSGVILSILTNIGVLLLGCLCGYLLKWMLGNHGSDSRLIIVTALLFSFCGLCVLLDVSPLLGCMAMSAVYINVTDDERLFQQLSEISPPILLLFFVHSGLCFQMNSLTANTNTIGSVSLLQIGVLYFVTRIAGKYAGAWLGCLVTGKDRKIRRYLGLALIPQAGVAVGLAALCQRTLGGTVGNDLQTIILASSVLYELIGPGCAKLALYRSGSYVSAKKKPPVSEKTETDGTDQNQTVLSGPHQTTVS